MSLASRKVIRRRRSWIERFRWLTKTSGEPRTPIEARYIALTGVASLERYLEDAIRSKLRRLSKKNFDELFSENAPLGTLSAKIKLAHAMRFYGPKTKADLEHLREIRNIFAHAERPITFRTKRIRDLCYSLNVPSRYPVDPEWVELIGDKRSPYSNFVLTLNMLEIEIEKLSYRRRRGIPRDSPTEKLP